MKKSYFLLTILLMTIVSFAQPANDDCANAELLTISNNITTISFDINSAVLSNQLICETTSDYADVWYQFTLPYNGNVDLNGSSVANNFALYDACGGNQIMCINRHGLLPNLTANTVYILRLFRTTTYASDPANQSFTIQGFQEVANDTCDTAQDIVVTTNSTTVNFEIGGAYINNEVGCEGNTPKSHADIWYDFTMPVNGNININSGFGINNFALYDACNGIQIGCFIQNGSFQNLTSGSSYKLRVFRTSQNAYYSFFKSFSISIDPTLGLSDEPQNVVKIYPIPASNLITINYPLEIENIEFYSLLGKLVLQEQQSYSINISNLSDGLYIIKIHTPKGVVSKKMIKKQ